MFIPLLCELLFYKKRNLLRCIFLNFIYYSELRDGFYFIFTQNEVLKIILEAEFRQ